MKHILVATDGSQHATKAVREAADLSHRLGVPLTILNVQDDRPLTDNQQHFAEVELEVPLQAPAPLLLPTEFQALYQRLGSRDALELFGQHQMMVRQQISDRRLADAEVVARKAGAAKIDTVSVAGDAAHEIIAAAHKSGADLIVLGRRGLSGIRELLLGSVSQKVVHHAKVDVLTVS